MMSDHKGWTKDYQIFGTFLELSYQNDYFLLWNGTINQLSRSIQKVFKSITTVKLMTEVFENTIM